MMYRATLGVQQAHNGIEVFLADITIGGSEDRFRAPIIVGLLHLRGNIVERFVPTDALPLITTAHLAIGGVGAPTLRFMGYLMRAGEVMLLIWARPRGQARRWGTSMESSSSSVRIRSGTPSSTYTRRRQRECSQLQLFMQAPVSHCPLPFSPG